MTLYVMTTMWKEDGASPDEYYGSQREALRRANELWRDREENDLYSVEVERFELARLTFKEAVLACLNQTGFIKQYSRQQILYKEVKR